MKKTFSIFLIAFLLIPISSFCQAGKFGHVNYGEIIKLMPGIDSVQKIIVDFQTELQSTGEEMAKEFKTKQAEYEQLQNNSSSTTILRIKEEELTNMYQRIQEFSQSMETELQNKQLELLKPFQEQVLEAIKTVAEEQHISYVFDTLSLAYSIEGEDLSAKVKAKLNIK